MKSIVTLLGCAMLAFAIGCGESQSPAPSGGMTPAGPGGPPDAYKQMMEKSGTPDAAKAEAEKAEGEKKDAAAEPEKKEGDAEKKEGAEEKKPAAEEKKEEKPEEKKEEKKEEK